MDTLTLLRKTISERTSTPAEKVIPEATLESLEVDSLMLLDLMFEFEDQFGVTMPKDLPQPKTVGDLIAVFDSLRAGAEK